MCAARAKSLHPTRNGLAGCKERLVSRIDATSNSRSQSTAATDLALSPQLNCSYVSKLRIPRCGWFASKA
jgi:hypothetical protein